MRPPVLIVDDDPAIRALLADALADAGYAICTAANGHEALALARQAPPQLVLLDLNMPLLDGWACCPRLQAIAPDAAVIVMSAEQSAAEEATRLGAAASVAKPFDLGALLALVEVLQPPMDAREGGRSLPVVAVIDTTDAATALLCQAVAAAGCATVTARTVAFAADPGALAPFLAQSGVQAVVWSVAAPYAENWQRWQRLQAAGEFGGRSVVLITENKVALEGEVGPTPTLEVAGRAADLHALTAAVRGTLVTRLTQPSDHV